MVVEILTTGIDSFHRKYSVIMFKGIQEVRKSIVDTIEEAEELKVRWEANL